MKFHTTMARSCQTSSPKATGFHIKVAPIFLYHHVGRNFRRTKEAVLALVNWEILSNPLGKSRVIIVPSGCKLFKANGVGTITIDFVGGHEDEYRIGSVTAGCLKQIHCADCVNIEIIVWSGGGKIMTRLRGS